MNAYNCDGSILALGGPGSGKTTLALLKAKLLFPHLKPGQRILFLSFSRSAVQQVMSSCGQLLTTAERQSVVVQTYHAFCLDLIRCYGRLLTGYPPTILFPDQEHLRKAEFIGDWHAETLRLAEAEGLYVFDLFADAAVRLVAGSATISGLVSDKYPYIIFDEFQDTSDSQWELVQCLAQRSTLTFLADTEQRIFDYDYRVNPERLDQLSAELHPQVFDLGSANYRSPNTDILSFANAVLHNRPLPDAGDVHVAFYPSRTGMDNWATHLAVIQAFQQLKKDGVAHPTVAVLTRSNSLVASVSDWLRQPSPAVQNRVLPPIPHDVVWDADLAASAAHVVGTIMDWPNLDQEVAVAQTLDACAEFYLLKSAANPTRGKTARALGVRLRDSAQRIRDGHTVVGKAATHIFDAWFTFLPQIGNPQSDWIAARDILAGVNDLAGVLTHARFTRLFGATDEIGGRLAHQWNDTGTYANAGNIVRRAIDAGRVMSEAQEPRGCLVMNIHKSKGKEFDGVVLVEGRYAGVFFNPKWEKEPFEATRRLLRVGITRARQVVFIVRPAGAQSLTDQ